MDKTLCRMSINAIFLFFYPFMTDDNYNLLRIINVQYSYNFNKVDYCIDSIDEEFINRNNIRDINLFEKIMDRLDKHWFTTKQNDIKTITPLASSDQCDVCTKKEKEDDPILICQGCSISMHRDCYGSSYSKDEFFLCQCCIFHDLDHTCIFCLKEGGAMKMTSNYKFGHILCVIFDKSLDFDNPISKEPIYIEDYKPIIDDCMFCKNNYGTKIECNFDCCFNIYHLTCGIDKVYFDIANKISYCQQHDPTIKRCMFTSNSSFRNLYSGYVKINNPPLIRQKVKMSEWKDTKYSLIIKSEPKIYEDVYKLGKDTDKNFIKSVCNYWLCKRNIFKTYDIHYLRHTVEK